MPNFPKGVVDGWLEPGQVCDFEADICSKSSVACKRTHDTKYHCGYCKSFRLIRYMREHTDGVPVAVNDEVKDEVDES